MTSHSTSFTAASTATLFPLNALVLDELNVRQDHDEVGIRSLAESIAATGLLNGLNGLRREDGSIGIVAGGRRLKALQLLESEGRFDDLVPVNVTEDAELAETWSHTENAAREDVSVVQEVIAFRKLAREQKKTDAEIAIAFGVTELRVKRRMKLAKLPDPVLDALEAGKITVDMAQAFSVCTSEERVLAVLNAALESGTKAEWWVTRQLNEGSVGSNTAEALYVGKEAYCEAGGTIAVDLFDDNSQFENAELLNDLFAAKVAEAKEYVVEEEGWLWAEFDPNNYAYAYDWERKGYTQIHRIPGVLTEEEEAELEALDEKSSDETLDEAEEARLEELESKQKGEFSDEQKALAGLVVFVSNRGKLTATGAFVRKEDREAAIKAGILSKKGGMQFGADQSDAPTEKPVHSNALNEDLLAIELGAAQTAMLDNPEIALDVAAFVLSGAADFGEYLMDVGINQPPVTPSNAEGYALPDDLGGVKKMSFEDFQKQDAESKQRALTVGVARLLTRGWSSKKASFEALTAMIGSDMRRVWTPQGSTYFKRVALPVLQRAMAEIMGWVEGSDEAKEFAKFKKKDAVAVLDGLLTEDAKVWAEWDVDDAIAERIKNWTPEGY